MKSIFEINIFDLKWVEIGKAIFVALVDTIKYEYSFYLLLIQSKKYEDFDVFESDIRAKVQLFSLSLTFKMWSRPHYRSATFQQDMINNLRNVAIPGTGVPLSLFCYHWITCLLFVLVLNPVICILGAINKSWKVSSTTQEFLVRSLSYYSDHLLHPDDWFSYWRLNCSLVSYHSMLTRTDGYALENKWQFLVRGNEKGVPVSPFLSDVSAIVCKNINVEGGMGIHFYQASLNSRAILIILNFGTEITLRN